MRLGKQILACGVALVRREEVRELLQNKNKQHEQIHLVLLDIPLEVGSDYPPTLVLHR